uniref:Translation elongation factor EF1B beta/delta subunit guanine nucleotide exchange domain-containing protein n=1 Tax=Rhinopithecus roxellana TaxID=61622 RepID=A0A2K6Q7Q0_RHIRO
MATNFSIHEKIWFDKLKYNDAERRFSKQMNEPVASTSRQENGPRASSGPSGEHSELVVQIELQQTMSKLEAWLNVLEKSSVGHQATVPQTQHLSPMSEDDKDDDVDLFGSDNEEEDKEAAQLQEEWLRHYAEKKAKKPVVVANSSILLDFKPRDDERNTAQLEACVRFIQLEGLVCGASKLVPVGYGIQKLQIQCVVGTDLLEEEITMFEEHVQSVNTAAFNKS